MVLMEWAAAIFPMPPPGGAPIFPPITRVEKAMLILEKRIDVREAAPVLGAPLEMAVTLCLPDPALMPPRPVAIFAAPGGGYSRRYFDLRFDAHDGYGEARWHAERGIIHVAIDHVGVGDSTIPDLSKIDFQTLAATHDSCVRQVARLLERGEADKRFPATGPLFKVGMGQSMGGGVTILTQGRFAPFDAIAPCGVSAIHTVLPQRDEAALEKGKRRFLPVAEGRVTSHEQTDHEGVDYLYAFHWEDVPADILHEDMKGGYPIRETAPDFGSLTIPHCAVRMMLPGAFAEDAARVAVPVLVANGERDTCPHPHREAAAYSASRDVTIFIAPTMAHMHNFASTRAILWEKLHGWSRMLAAAAAG
ncbi:alpha-beta hydrolase superfamily lysophospholipase [Sphingobium jiangsuense]|uniref:Alpha-beta hydrolase superfamily lysophospholipase n=1 Tax=Sphingobium jiangsuense TaxID=870476 RepID=A0A7W6BQB4_9SPHN|nr:lysophospholipase [Sphingobium jiangsuense]MBB3925914.1 alpha-beta hydrolase superfamily lysophospholipase [Sphingobium jiangsuense]